MTNPTPAGVTGVLRSSRALAVWGLLGFTALYLFFGFFSWVLPGGSFAGRSAAWPFTADLVVMAMPVVAVLLAVHVKPVMAGAKLVAVIALIEYAVALLFGGLTFLIGLGAAFDDVYGTNDAFNGFRYLVIGAARLLLIAIAAYVVYQSFVSVGGKLTLPTGTATPNPGYQSGAAPTYPSGTAQVPTDPAAPQPYRAADSGYQPDPPTQPYQQNPPTA